MQVESRILDDLTRVVSGAMGTIFGMRDEVEAQIRQQFERVLSRMDVVTREEFEAVRAMAVKAREEQEAMAERLAALESRLAEAAAPRRRTARAAASTPRTVRKADGTDGEKPRKPARRRKSE
mgnify:CR=1 FL=1|jgi:BMFP domain-containing protein YqiC